MLNYLQSALYLTMNIFLYPVIVLLLCLLVWILVLGGGFTSEWLVRRRMQDIEELAAKVWNEISGNAYQEASRQISAYMQEKKQSISQHSRDFLTQFSRGLSGVMTKERLTLLLEELIEETQIKMEKSMDKTRILVRIAPMLGLMGTLIPMGPALLALSHGDIGQMANSLIIAFSTTVVGLAIAGAAYIMTAVRERWYEEDVKDISYFADFLLTVESDGGAK